MQRKYPLRLTDTVTFDLRHRYRCRQIQAQAHIGYTRQRDNK